MKGRPIPHAAALILILTSASLVHGKNFKAKVNERREQIQHLQSSRLARSVNLLQGKIAQFRKLRMAGPVATDYTPTMSYMSVIPFVTRENNFRTNIGINNFSQNSFVKGTNPNAIVSVGFFDKDGNINGAEDYVVRTNELVQINDVISALHGTAGSGWLMIVSDEPFTSWASVISNSTNDPSIEQAIPIQLGKPSAYVEDMASGWDGTRLLIPSSVKTATYQSSLVVLNVGPEGGNFTITIYGNDGQVLDTKSSYINADGLYISNDIRRSATNTYGQIIIEPNDSSLVLMASSNVVSSSGNGAFFPAFTIPPSDQLSVAGMWEGSLTGGTTDAKVSVTLFQERSMLYGWLDIVSGSFPTTSQSFAISGGIDAFGYATVQVDDLMDEDSNYSYISFRMIGYVNSDGTGLEGTTLYTDERKQQNLGSFTLTRTGHIF